MAQSHEIATRGACEGHVHVFAVCIGMCRCPRCTCFVHTQVHTYIKAYACLPHLYPLSDSPCNCRKLLIREHAHINASTYARTYTYAYMQIMFMFKHTSWFIPVFSVQQSVQLLRAAQRLCVPLRRDSHWLLR
jgi:hypothetical protein